MSWALEEWKEGLPSRALQKIQELEGQLEKLKKEKQQRQFQLDSLEAALQKQKQKVEDGKTEGADLKRENQRLMEICEHLEKSRQKLSHELQVKESQVNLQESQLSSCKKQIEKLEQELKRCKSEFERSQQVAQSADVSLNPCSTPQKLFATPLTPSSTYEDLKEKYNKEVEERKRLEEEVKALHAKKVSLPVSQATMNHRDIARHQASSSVFPWQQENTPSRLSSDALKTPLRRDGSAAHFLGEEVSPNKSSMKTGRGDCSSLPGEPHSAQLLHQAKAQNQDLKSKMTELELRLQGQEKEMRSQVNKCQDLQLQLEKTKVELIEKERILNKTRDEVVRSTAQYDQAAAKCTTLEQKLKTLTEELSCHRQNAESAKRSLEQRIKEKEKELQEELSRQHQSFQALDSEYTQMKTRLTQELQQVKHLHSTLQLELEKVTSVKQQLERNLEEIRLKLSRAEQALQASQVAENELRRSSEEMKKENSLIRSQSEQRTREVCHLEEELGKVKVSLSKSQNFAEEMKAKNTSQEIMLRDLQEKLNQQENSLTLEKLKLALADLERQRNCSQDLLKKREHHIDQLNNKLNKIEKEFETLLSALELKKKECEELKEEKNQISFWKIDSEKLINQIESEKEILLGKINHLETSLKTQQVSPDSNERIRTLEMERENFTVEIKNLQSMLDSKMVEIKTQKQAYLELQQKSESSDQKHQKEIENMCLKANKLTGQVESLECKLQLLSSEVVTKDQQYQDLRMEYETLRDLLKSRGSSLVTNEDNQRSSEDNQRSSEDNQRGSLAFEQQPAVSDSFANVMGRKGSINSERSDCSVDGGRSPEHIAILQNRVTSLESSLESQNQMNSDLQMRCEELLQIKGEVEENLSKAEQIHQNFVAETNQCISKLQEDAAVHQNIVAETLATLESKEKELQLLKEKLEAQQTEVQKLNKNNCLLEGTLKELQLLSDTLSSEKKEMNSIISLSKKNIEELTQANEALKEVNEALEQEKMNLLQKHEKITSCIAEQERSIAELSDQYKQERLQLLQRCEETEAVLEDLRGNYKTAQENNAKLECMLSECTALCENRKNELEQLKETFAKEQQEFLTKLAFAEEQNRKLMLELEIEQQTVRSEITNTNKHSMSATDGLRQECLTLNEEQNEQQNEVSNLTHENEQLMELTQTKHDSYLAVEPVENSVKATEDEIGKSSSQYQMDIDTKDISLDSYKAQLVHLEALVRILEVQLDQSEEENKKLHLELQTIREELETKSSQDPQSQARTGLKDCDTAEEKYVSMLQELSASQNENAHLQCSLQTAVNKLNELGKMCDVLRVEKLQLESELNDSRTECITATSQMTAEVEKLVSEMKMLNHESALSQNELMKDTSGGEFHDKANHSSVFLTPLDSSNFCEQMTLSSKEVRVHFAELQEKFSCLQSEHKILHDQHCEVSSKMSALRSYVDTLKAENSALSMSLRTLQGDLVKEGEPAAEGGHGLPLSFCGADSPSLTNFGETSFYKDVLEQTGDTCHLSLEGNASANSCDLDEEFSSSLEEETLTEKESPPAPGRTVEGLEVLCQVYLQSLKNLEEKTESQRIMKNKEIEKLEQLLSSERKELSCLRKQYLSEKEQWQQKLTSVTLEMESKLAEEKQQTKTLSLELEVARLQLQELDLSSRSLLGTDLESVVRCQNDNYDIKESEVYISETTEKTPKQDTDQTCDKDIQQDLGLETSVTESETTRLTGEGCEEQPPKTNCEAPAEDKTQDCSECISELCSSSNVLVPMDVLEDQGSIQNLQLQKDTLNENLRLLPEVEDWDKKVESLLNEIMEADSKLSLQEVQLKMKIATCIQLEKIVKDLRKEKADLSEKLESLPCNQEVCLRVERSEEDLGFNLDMGANELLSKSTKDNATNTEDNYKEKFLDMERELTRIKSEKANIEHHILSVETNLEVVQAEKLCLERDTESKQKVIIDLKEELFTVISERNRLREELDNVSKESKALDQMSKKMKEKIEELESHQRESLRHIGAVESEVKDKADLIQTLSFNVGELTKDKAHLQEQLQNLQNDSQELSLAIGELEIQIGQLNKEKESLVKESQNFQIKLTESECEKQTISKALEVALKEKGEFAVQLSSAQEEVHQLRRGIEKLSVRIEADEKKHLSAVAKLKESQRESDSLKDTVETLERELERSEENQELAILDSENLKAEVETLKAQKDEMTKSLRIFELDLVTVRTERENLAKQLQEKQSRVSELDERCSSLRRLLEEKEQARVQMEEDSKSAMLMLQMQLKELREEVAALCNDQETLKAQEQSLDQPGEEVHHLKSSIRKLKVHIDADEKKHQNILEQLKESKHHADLLKDRVENLEQELILSEKNMIFQAEKSKAEIQTLKSEIQRMAQNLQDLQLELISTRSENENLMKELKKEQERVSDLETINSSIENLLKDKEQEKVQMKEEAKITVEMLQTQLKELNETVVSLCNDQEVSKTKEQNLGSQVQTLELEKAQLLQDLGEAKNKYIIFQSSVNALTQEVEAGKQKLEKGEKEIRTLKEQLKSQEQLVCKLAQVEGEQQLWQKQKLELRNVTMALEQKVQVLQSENNTLQSTYEALQNSHKSLESELGLIKLEKVALVERVSTISGKEAELQRELRDKSPRSSATRQRPPVTALPSAAEPRLVVRAGARRPAPNGGAEPGAGRGADARLGRALVPGSGTAAPCDTPQPRRGKKTVNMELRRGKTFIKSSVQISHEKLIDSPAKEDPDKWPLSLGEQQRAYGEKSSQTSPCSQGYGRCPNKEVLSDPEGGPVPLCGTTFKLVRKSKTHDSVPGAVKAAAPTGQMVGSTSFSETPGGQRMIDYRHFVPQMPFVPAVAKSIPRKRISLKRSKKCFRNLFHMRRSKTENLASLSAKGKNLSPSGVPAQQGTAFLSMGEGLGLDSLCQDLSDSEFLHDSPFDLCSALCEDVASLKSFDSLTGCGEIFADGSSVPSVELKDGPESPAHSPQALDCKTPCGPAQGGMEQLMSPAQNEASDFNKFWDSVNRSVQQQQRALMGPWLTSPEGTETDQTRLDTSGLAELPLFPCRGPPSGSKASSIDTGTPKSEQPESVSTSDEGYYDSFSPGLEEEKKEAASPGTPAATFPRDSYSGDALYELFYDPSEAPVGPILDDDCVSESLSGPALGTPLSMCSFRVGAEENLAPAPGPDLLSQGFLQSTWKGKECLLKLCDTELAITMGIVNWLRRTPPATSPTPASTPAPTPALVLREPAAPPDPHRVLRGASVGVKGREDQATTCFPPSRQEPWAHSGTKNLLVRECEVLGEPARGSKTPSKDDSLEEGTQDFSEGQSSSEATMTSISGNNKAVTSATCLSSQKELGTPGNLRYSQGPLRPGHRGSALDPGPMLVGCVTHVAALQIYPDSNSPRQDKGNGLFWKPQAWGPNILQKNPISSKPNEAAGCGLSSSASPQDQKCRDLFLDLNQLKLEPSRLGPQACSSVDSQPQQLCPRAPEQVPHRGSVGS